MKLVSLVVGSVAVASGFSATNDQDNTPVLYHYADAIEMAKDYNCQGIHDKPSYEADLLADYKAHDMGDGTDIQWSQARRR